MTDQLKPKAWLIDHKHHCTGIEIACDDRSDVIEHWRKEGKATPLYEIPDGYQLVPIEPSRNQTIAGSKRSEIVASKLHYYEVDEIYRAMLKAARGE